MWGVRGREDYNAVLDDLGAVTDGLAGVLDDGAGVTLDGAAERVAPAGLHGLVDGALQPRHLSISSRSLDDAWSLRGQGGR